MTGFSPSHEDESAYELLKASGGNVKDTDYPNIFRWYKHMEAFSADERGKFPVTMTALASVNFNVRTSTLFD